jgi:hypothetical protein
MVFRKKYGLPRGYLRHRDRMWRDIMIAARFRAGILRAAALSHCNEYYSESYAENERLQKFTSSTAGKAD